ncbi:hypothetical protein EV363DRAFT_1150689, partial [Boletus edulis]
YLSNLPDTLPVAEAGLTTYNFGSFSISADEIEDYGEIGAVNRQLDPGKGKHRVQKLDSKILDNSHDSDYEDLPESEDHRKSGARLLPLLLQVSKHCHLKMKLSVDRARCIGRAAVIDDEIDDGNDWLDEPHQLDPATVGVERHTFTLGGRDDIDLSSSYLRNILSDTDITQTHAETASTSRNEPASGSSSATKPPPASMDWDSWE